MIQILKKIFGGADDTAPAPTPAAPKADRPATADGYEGIEGFVTFVVRSLVDHPDKVEVTSEEKDSATLITVNCEKQDIGKIIGRRGKTISAIRALANGAGGKLGQRINVEVLD